jgi:hypothetical protein
MKRYQKHISYVLSRMLLIVILFEIIYYVLASAFEILYVEGFWTLLFFTIPIIAVIAFGALIHAVFKPGKSKLSAKFGAQMSLVAFLVSSITFAALIGTIV